MQLEHTSAIKVHSHAQAIAVGNEAITEWNIMLGWTNPSSDTADKIRAVDVHRSGMKMPSVAPFVRPDGIFTPLWSKLSFIRYYFHPLHERLSSDLSETMINTTAVRELPANQVVAY